MKEIRNSLTKSISKLKSSKSEIIMNNFMFKDSEIVANNILEKIISLVISQAFERMIQAAGSPEMAVQWKMVDQYKGIAEAQAKALEHIQLGNVTVWGDKNTGADFAKSFVQNFAPVLSTINTEVKDQFKDLFNLKKETPTLGAPTDPEPNNGNGGTDLLPGTGDDTYLHDTPDQDDDFEDVK